MSRLFWIITLTMLTLSCKPPPKKVSAIVDGYTDKVSYDVTDSISLFINANKEIKNYEINITDINGKVIKSIITDVCPQKFQQNKPYENGFNYRLSTTLSAANFKSGIYLFDNKIPFVIKPNESVDVLIVYSSNTENAYTNSGGKSAYPYNSSEKIASAIVSFNRPIGLPAHSSDFFKWIGTKKNYKIAYIADKDLDDYKNLSYAKLIVITGHSEYWTRKARENFDKFVKEGNNALILSGNTMWWQVRYNEKENQMICYRDQKIDPEKDPFLKTINWTDSSLQYPVFNAVGLDFNRGGFGKDIDKGWDGYKIVNPSSPMLKGTGLELNDLISLPTDEYDGGELIFSADSNQVTLNNSAHFYRYELIGYDFAKRFENANGAWIIMQNTINSGVIINTGSTDWCRKAGMEGESSSLIKKITLNMIDLLLNVDKNKLFTSDNVDSLQ